MYIEEFIECYLPSCVGHIDGTSFNNVDSSTDQE